MDTEPDRPLLDVLREDFGLTGTKYGCGEGQCRACTVLMDGKPVRSCITPVRMAAGRKIVTIEGLAAGGKLHNVQQAFVDEGAMQCGYCTPGMVMSTAALLDANPKPTDAQVIEAPERQSLPLRRLPAHSRGRAPRRGRRKVNESFEPERYELREGPAYRFELNRREFAYALGAGPCW